MYNILIHHQLHIKSNVFLRDVRNIGSQLYDIWKRVIEENQKKNWRMAKNNNFGRNLNLADDEK